LDGDEAIDRLLDADPWREVGTLFAESAQDIAGRRVLYLAVDLAEPAAHTGVLVGVYPFHLCA
jgi:hypothetical protein